MSFNVQQLETRNGNQPQIYSQRTAKRILARRQRPFPCLRVPSQSTLFVSTASLTLYSLLRLHFIFI
jgi:hypothetical protein